MPCGHTIHKSCLKAMQEHYQYACPLCSKSVCDMSKVWEKFDVEIAATPMPEPYQNKMVWILCNDCGSTSEVQFHIVGQKCPNCKSYNTRQTRWIQTVEWWHHCWLTNVVALTWESLTLAWRLTFPMPRPYSWKDRGERFSPVPCACWGFGLVFLLLQFPFFGFHLFFSPRCSSWVSIMSVLKRMLGSYVLPTNCRGIPKKSIPGPSDLPVCSPWKTVLHVIEVCFLIWSRLLLVWDTRST